MGVVLGELERPDEALDAQLRALAIFEKHPEDSRHEMSTLLAQGRLVHAVGQRFPLDAIADAHEAVERGAVIGNVVLDIP